MSTTTQMKWILGEYFYTLQGSGGTNSTKLTGASKTGARAGRVVRLVRMARLVRLIKLYKYGVVAARKKKMRDLAKLKGEKVDDDEENELLTESKVGTAMSDLTNKR